MRGREKLTVQVLAKIFGPQSRNLQQAMDLTSHRHSLLTKNLSNVNVIGYKREDMDFATQLDEEEGKGGSNLAAMNKGRNGQGSDRSIRIDGNSVDLETEVMQIAEMEMRYQAISEMTSRYFGGLQTVIKDGR